MFKAEDGSGLDLTFTSAKFVVEKWEGIQVSESDATALVTGHYETYGKNGKIQDASSQWLVSLNRDAANHKWLLADRKGVRIED
jgi:hypothetical protein